MKGFEGRLQHLNKTKWGRVVNKYKCLYVCVCVPRVKATTRTEGFRRRWE